MQLLFKREQASGRTAAVKFRLWGKVELEEQELQIIRRYRLDKAVLIEAFQPQLMRKATYLGLAAFIVSFGLIYSAMSFSVAIALAALAGAGAGYLYYDRNRESVLVRDLMYGRHFACDSVVDLARKEAWLGMIVGFLRQVMESAKHWDGTEAVDVPVLDKDDAKALIVRGL